MNLYTDLGITPTASTEEVKKAFRQKASSTHPDKGGNAEEFQRVHAAYKILSDPAKRQRYDETGDAEIADKWEMIVEMEFTKIILKILDQDHSDIADAARKEISEIQISIAVSIKQNQRELERNTKKITRVKLIATGNDPILNALQNRAAKLKQAIREADADSKLYAAVLLQLDRYEFQKKEPILTTATNQNNNRYITQMLSDWTA